MAGRQHPALPAEKDWRFYSKLFVSFLLFLSISWLVDAMCSILYIRKNKYELLTENFLMEYQEKKQREENGDG